VLLAALLFGCAATSAHAQATVFVSARNGVDSGNCASAAPCRTVNFALTQATVGGTALIVDSGDYDNSITIDKNVTIAAAPGVAAVFSAEGVVSAFAGLTVRVSNSTITGNLTGLLPDSGGLLLTRRNNTVESNNTDGAFTGVFTAK